MVAFVLVHGAWHGAWCWARVLPALRAAGHTAHAVTLTGVGERAHLLSRDITLGTHIGDVVNLTTCEELSGVVLVGHSYGGLVITGAADRLAGRAGLLKHLVYIDAVVPHPGESWASQHAPELVANRLAASAAHPQGALPAPDAALYGLTGADCDWDPRLAQRRADAPARAQRARLARSRAGHRSRRDGERGRAAGAAAARSRSLRRGQVRAWPRTAP